MFLNHKSTDACILASTNIVVEIYCNFNLRSRQQQTQGKPRSEE